MERTEEFAFPEFVNKFPHRKNSFEEKVTDWQTVPDIQDFYEKDWIQEESRIKITPTFGKQHTQVSTDIKLTRDLQIIENVEVRHTMPATDGMGVKELGCEVTEDQIKLQYDAGFKPSWTYLFNPYYKLAFYRSPAAFRKASVGLNFGDQEGRTHHEFSVINNLSETYLRIRNSYMMTWRIFKYYSLNTTEYGKKIKSSGTSIVSVHPHEKFSLVVVSNSVPTEKEENMTNYNVGFKFDLKSWLSFYTNVHFHTITNYSWMAGCQVKNYRGFSGKVATKDLEEAHAYISTSRYANAKISLVTALPLNWKRKTRNPAFGLDIAVNF